MKALKKDQRWFLFNLNYFILFQLSLFSRYFSWLFSHIEKQLDQKDNIGFKIYDVTVWLINNSMSMILSRKMFLIFFPIKWWNYITWLSLLLEILVNTCITIACVLGFDVINFGINLILLIKPFFYITNKSRQKVKYFGNEKSF